MTLAAPASPAPPAVLASACTFAPDLHEAEWVKLVDEDLHSGQLDRNEKSKRADGRGHRQEGVSGQVDPNLKTACRPLSILDRREFQCAWIVGAEAGIATCCGAPVLSGASWCPEHRAIVFAVRGEP